jgi:hypothetical protein
VAPPVFKTGLAGIAFRRRVRLPPPSAEKAFCRMSDVCRAANQN